MPQRSDHARPRCGDGIVTAVIADVDPAISAALVDGSPGIEGDQFGSVVDGYKDNKDNKPDTLQSQLDALRSVSFKDVDCHYKYGIFTLFGGRKQ